MKDMREDIFKAFFQQSPVPAIISGDANSNFVLIEANKAFWLVMNIGTSKISNLCLMHFFNRQIMSPTIEKKLKDGLKKAELTGDPVSFTINKALDSPLQSTFWRVKISPVQDPGASSFYFIINLYDLGDLPQKNEHEEGRREMGEELTIANEELTIINEELCASQESLQQLNLDLENRVAQRTKALEESEERLSNIMETIPQMAWTCALDGKINFYNSQWHSYTGFNMASEAMLNFDWYAEPVSAGREYAYPKGWFKIVHPDDMAETSKKFLTILKSEQGGEFEARFRHYSGKYRWHLNRLLPFKNAKGEIELWVGTATDIDEIRRLQQQKDDFISIASHELKTPINSLKASLELMDKLKSNLQHEMLPKLIIQSKKSIQRVSTLIEDLLNVRKLQQGQMQLNKSRFHIYELINSCCNPITIAGKHRVFISGDIYIEVYADEHRIDQVITNLLNNAVKYAANSELIQLLIQKADSKIKVSVTDHGPGIQKENVEHLFERYYRVNSSGNQVSGLGLGLYISNEIIKRHGGEMGVDTEPGNGCTFWFTLPAEASTMRL